MNLLRSIFLLPLLPYGDGRSTSYSFEETLQYMKWMLSISLPEDMAPIIERISPLETPFLDCLRGPE